MLRSFVTIVALAGLAIRAEAVCPGDCSVPGGGPVTRDCIAEFDGPTLNYPTVPKMVRCTDGDPACDDDGVPNGACLMNVRVCLNNPDVRFPLCIPTDVASVDIRNAPPGTPRFNAQFDALESAIAGLTPTASAVCTSMFPVSIPLKVSGTSFRKGKQKLRSKAYTSGGATDGDKLRYLCDPSPAFPGPAATFARAKVITDPAELIEGQLSRGDLGDLIILNDKIQVVIQKPGRVMYDIGTYGGNIIDADRQRTDGTERDSFEELAPGINVENTANYTSVIVLNDGTDGNPAVIEATGPDDLLDFINPSSVVAGFGFPFPPAADDTDLPIDIATKYILAGGDSYVKIETTITNTGGVDLDIFFAEYLNGSGQVELFQPTYGFGEPLVTTSCATSTYKPCGPLQAQSCDLCNYLAYAGEDLAGGVSYGYVSPYNKTTVFSTSGVSVALLGQEAVLTLIGAAAPNFHMEPSGNPGDSITVTRYFAVGDGNVSSIAAIRNGIQNITTGTLAGTVTAGATPIADADVAVTGTVVAGPLGSPTKNIVNHTRTAADGSYSLTLPPGSYTVQANKAGRLAASPGATPVAITAAATTTQNFTVPQPARNRVTVTDELGADIPAKLQLVGFDPNPDPRNTQSILALINNRTGMFGEEFEDGLQYGIAAAHFIDRTGDSGEIEMEPGSYQLVISKGPRYSSFTQNVTLTAGALTTVPAQIAKVIDTPGFIAGDFHVHSINSPDCEVTNQERIATELAEGMDFFTPSDHDIRVDFTGDVAAMGVGDLISTAPSAEITTFDYGHFNSWPVTVTGAVNGGSVDHGRAGVAPGFDFPSFGNYSLSPEEIIDEAHDDPRPNLVQINHMNSHFNTDGLDIDTAEGDLGPPTSHTPALMRRLDPAAGGGNLFSDDFDALEVWIGTDGRNGAATFLNENLGDWFNMLNQGILSTGVANSDTHDRRTTQMGARTYVASTVTDPGALVPEADTLAANVVAGKAFGTSGPFVTIAVDAASTSQSAGLGVTDNTMLATTDGTVTVQVDVTSPLWAEFDEIELYVNNAPQPWDHDADVTTRNRYRVIPNDSANVVPGLVDDFPLIPGAKHWTASHTFNVAGLTDDAWIVVVVKGNDSVSKPLFPVVPNSLMTTGNTTLANLTDGNLGEEGYMALAFTNPIYVEADGIPGWMAPGVMLTP